jgi:AcrR family transcriptional regulator
MPEPAARIPQRSHARANRARILQTAREELSRSPGASLDEIAQAAGVVRRTVYGYFPNRQALIGALVEEAGQALQQALTRARRPKDDPATGLARMTLAAWGVGDQYRMLISLRHRELGEEQVRAVLDPIRKTATSIITRGQRTGVFGRHLAPPILNEVIEALTLALLEHHGVDADKRISGADAATACLVAVGVTPSEARRCVDAALLDSGA